jgi:hypothetical protein
LVLFNDSNGFVQQFHWICFLKTALLLLPSGVSAARFWQSWPNRLSLQSLRNFKKLNKTGGFDDLRTTIKTHLIDNQVFAERRKRGCFSLDDAQRCRVFDSPC